MKNVFASQNFGNSNNRRKVSINRHGFYKGFDLLKGDHFNLTKE